MVSINRSVVLSLAIAGIVLISSAAAQERRQVPEFRVFGEPVSQAQKQDIDDLIDLYRESWAQQDAVTLASLHTEDTEWINAYARVFRGADSLLEFLRDRLFPAFDPEVSVQEAANMHTISLRYLNAETVVAHMYTDGARGASRNAAETQRRTHIHLVVVRLGDDWRIAHTVIMDAR